MFMNDGLWLDILVYLCLLFFIILSFVVVVTVFHVFYATLELILIAKYTIKFWFSCHDSQILRLPSLYDMCLESKVLGMLKKLHSQPCPHFFHSFIYFSNFPQYFFLLPFLPSLSCLVIHLTDKLRLLFQGVLQNIIHFPITFFLSRYCLLQQYC